MPDFPIIDAHVHLYDPSAVAYPWMAGVPALNTPHLPDRFVQSLGGVEVEGRRLRRSGRRPRRPHGRGPLHLRPAR